MSSSRSRLPKATSSSSLTGTGLRRRSPSPNPTGTPNSRGSKSPSRIPINATARLKTPHTPIAPTPTPSKPQLNSVPALSKNVGLKRLEALARTEHKSPLKRGRDGEPVKLRYAETEVGSTKPWVQKYEPLNVSNHFVHKKKIEEFQNWLTNPRGSNMCLLTGPAGSGKTATVHLVANELGYVVREWLNPMTLTTFNNPENVETLIQRDSERGDDVLRPRSQVDTFTDFLLKISTFNCLPIKFKNQQTTKTKKLILVEDFPSFFTRETLLFHQLLRNYKSIGECPLIFILSDSCSMDLNSNKLFPKTLLSETGVQQIQFNSVATTLLHKFLSNILTQENIIVDKSVVDETVAACSGDMRWAINNLQFRLQKPKPQKGGGSGSTFKKPAKKKEIKTGSGKSKPSGEGGRDENLFLFHGIGKVLYCKRDPNVVVPEEFHLPPKLKKEQRIHPTVEVPEHIGQKIGVGPETFFHFLGQNYLSFFSSLEDVVKVSGYLSDANYIFSSWVSDGGSSGGGQSYKNMELREELGLSVSIRGLMHSNTAQTSNSWKPLRKPGHIELNSRTQTMRESARSIFGGSISRDDFFPDLLPYYSNRNFSSKLNLYQLEFVKQYGSFQSSGSLGKGKQNLDEIEVVEMDDSLGSLEVSPVEKNPAIPISTLEQMEKENLDSIEPGEGSEDEYRIEDYDE